MPILRPYLSLVTPLEQVPLPGLVGAISSPILVLNDLS